MFFIMLYIYWSSHLFSCFMTLSVSKMSAKFTLRAYLCFSAWDGDIDAFFSVILQDGNNNFVVCYTSRL